MTTTYTYAVLGAGRQGTAAAYDLARHGRAARVLLADRDPVQARRAAARVNRLLGREVALPAVLDVADEDAVRGFLAPVDAAISAVPFQYNLGLTWAAIAAGTHLCDMGGHTATVFRQLEYDAAARAAGVSIVPDCGMGPGLINTLGAYIVEHMDRPRHVRIYDGGLPRHPRPPWNYALTFHINGLTNEYAGTTVLLIDGRLTEVEGLTGYERLTIEPLGELEAFITTGGASTAPWTFAGRLETYVNKTLRYPGHYEWFRAFKQLGLFDEAPIEVDGQRVVPRAVYHALLEPQIRARPDEPDVAVIRVVGEGEHDGRPARWVLDVLDEYDPATGFRAMERLTGWHCAAMSIFQAQGVVPAGAHPQETAVPPARMLDALRARGIAIREARAAR